MKLRIRGNSVRLRLGQSEVRQLLDIGTLEEATQFDPAGNHRLVYRVEAAAGPAAIAASFTAGRVLVRIPVDTVRNWASSDQVGIVGRQALGVSGELKILIEKDFECLDGTADEPQDDAYPHPGNRACGPGEDG